MKRRVLIILLFLLLGAIVNVAVAWTIWFAGEKPVPDPMLLPGEPGSIGTRELKSWNRCRSDHWPDEPEWAWDVSFFGSRFRSIFTQFDSRDSTYGRDDAQLDANRKVDSYNVKVIECGWPARCMTLDMWYEFHLPTPFTWQTNGWQIGRWHLPYRPIWPGFAINTVFYAAILWLLLFAAPRTLRRAIRKNRGRCIECGYDLRGSPGSGCPECGWNREDATT